MEKTIRILQHSIYPDFEEFEFTALKEYLSPYITKIDFFFDDGIELTYDENLVRPISCPGDISFCDVYETADIKITITETFNKVLFQRNGNEEDTFTVPILEFFKLNL